MDSPIAIIYSKVTPNWSVINKREWVLLFNTDTALENISCISLRNYTIVFEINRVQLVAHNTWCSFSAQFIALQLHSMHQVVTFPIKTAIKIKKKFFDKLQGLQKRK